MDYDWPGNVRQLENLIKRMVVLGTEAADPQGAAAAARHCFRSARPSSSAPRAPRVRPPPPSPRCVADGAARRDRRARRRCERRSAAAPPRPAATCGGNVSLKDIARTAAREAERELILRMLTRTRWNRKEAAEILGISYKALLYKIKENGLDKAS